MSRWLKLPTRKQLQRVLHASEVERLVHEPLTETQRRINAVTRQMLDTLIDGPWLEPFARIPPPAPSGTIRFRRYTPGPR